MQSKIFICSALFSAFANAALDNVNLDAAAKVATDLVNYAVTLATNSEYSNDIVAIATAIPSSVVAQAYTDPNGFENSLETGTKAPAWISAIPTPVVNSLNSILAKPNNADDALAAIVTNPQNSAVLANSAIPTSIQDKLFTDPLDLIGDYLTATGDLAWATPLPTTLQSQIGSILNADLSTVAAVFESSSKPSLSYSTQRASAALPSSKPVFPSGSGTTCPPPVTLVVTVTASPILPPFIASSSSIPKSVGTNPPAVKPSAPTASVPKGTAASTGVKPYTSTKGGAPIAFTGAAAPMKTAAVGAAALFAGAGVLLNA